MGCWDIYCVVCGNACYIDPKWILNLDQETQDKLQGSLYNALYKKMKWMEKCTMLLMNNDVVHGCREKDCNISFETSNGTRYESSDEIDYFDDSYKNNGIFVHTDCWKFVKETYGIELTYGHLPIIDRDTTDSYPLTNINYGAIVDYWQQDTRYADMFMDKKIWMAFSPLDKTHKNYDKNISRIKKIISQLKLKKETRQGPSVSATFYKNGIYKVGNNKKIWQKKAGKWMQISDELIIKKYPISLKKIKSINQYKINKLRQIGSCYDKPIFITKFIKDVMIEVIGTEKTISDLDKLIK